MDVLVAKLWSQQQIRLACHVFISLLFGAGLVWLSAPTAQTPKPKHVAFNQLSCADTERFTSLSSKPTLTILIPAHTMAKKALSVLCVDSTILAHYANVKVVWQTRQALSPKMLFQHRFDVMWERDYRLSGLIPNYQDHYRNLIQLPTYSAYWYSNQHDFTPTTDYFQHHKIGLLADRYSLSGYQIPLKQLAKFGLDEQAQQVRLYPSRSALITALKNGDVDVIADSNFSPINQTGGAMTHAIIADNLPLGAWFISRQITGDALTRAIHDRLVRLTAS
ncbi:hypothetical protein SAMN04488136_13826 [Vibrio xiamenensis]|uniref:Solute-binding protein family 3/N-terminal domain-containing protein n=1 Tax=Vibrio xiamenensis TaxID=861298 RepID=A0A1G8GJX8_9VIBR|nr:hypothetical protein [Vibrio xiamenensis]SDH94673.1 hypothetical protein SAMN04488136_13826 [Vibrio xiamenensis]